MIIYNYDKITKEFTGTSTADENPEETKIQGKFVPLIPANATTKKPSKYNVYDEIPVFINDSWQIEKDYRYNFYKVDNNLNVSDIITIGEQKGFIIVDKALGDDIKINKDWYKIVDNEVVKKTEEEYNQEKKEQRIVEFNKTFFNTSLGYIRRKVTMENGETKDFLSDLLPTISLGMQLGQPVSIIAYNEPPFDKDIEDWTQYQHIETVTNTFIQECFIQLQKDFKTLV